MVRDTIIKTVFRIIAVVLFISGIAYLIVSSSQNKWLVCLVIFLEFIFIMVFYRYFIFRLVLRNFQTILKQTEGEIEKGSFFFAVPHSVNFKYSRYPCRIGYSIDWKLDHMLEYSLQIDNPVELVVIKGKRKIAHGEINLRSDFVISGEDKNIYNMLIDDAKIKIALNRLMSEFSYFYIGKDNQMRLIQRYDNYLAAGKKVFLIFDDLMAIADFLLKRKENEH